ncbi:putative calcium-binding protein CML19 [Heracleum sosnowskyi]|uniref:Calcium-binding protein CML19 n=1 Tax=Heracleum sosnowskyi TaxID=360622 RepID=A0AAD8JJD1_9APIA|nr:putative calcium-binding protein CML19 [Heracleum sosnowskyi]
MSSPRISSATSSSSSSPVNQKGKLAKQSSASAFKRLCQKLSPKQSPRNSFSSSSSIKSLASPEHINHAVENTSTSSKPFNEELVQRVFNYFDEDEDGKITASELRTCMTAVGGREMTLAEAEMAVETADSDGDGMLGLDDFSKLLETSCGTEEEELREAFGLYAAEGTSSITAKSLKRMLSRLGQSTSVDNCRAMIRKFDLNGDGVLNFDEFRVMMH